MPYEITKPSIMLQCDNCPCREAFGGNSVGNAKHYARENGWRLWLIPRQKKADGSWVMEQRKCLCPSCDKRKYQSAF